QHGSELDEPRQLQKRVGGQPVTHRERLAFKLSSKARGVDDEMGGTHMCAERSSALLRAWWRARRATKARAAMPRPASVTAAICRRSGHSRSIIGWPSIAQESMQV